MDKLVLKIALFININLTAIFNVQFKHMLWTHIVSIVPLIAQIVQIRAA